MTFKAKQLDFPIISGIINQNGNSQYSAELSEIGFDDLECFRWPCHVDLVPEQDQSNGWTTAGCRPMRKDVVSVKVVGPGL